MSHNKDHINLNEISPVFSVFRGTQPYMLLRGKVKLKLCDKRIKNSSWVLNI